jgi:hypothetical protein
MTDAVGGRISNVVCRISEQRLCNFLQNFKTSTMQQLAEIQNINNATVCRIPSRKSPDNFHTNSQETVCTDHFLEVVQPYSMAAQRSRF